MHAHCICVAIDRGSFSEEAAAAVLQVSGAEEPEALLQDLSDACLLTRVSSVAAADSRYSLHPLIWDLAERQRQAEPAAEARRQLAALEAYLQCMPWMLASGGVEGKQPGMGSTAADMDATLLLAEELPNISALAAQLGRLLKFDGVAFQSEATLDSLNALIGTLYMFRQPATAIQLQEAVQAKQRERLTRQKEHSSNGRGID
jgi:hypothetical protein